MNPHNSKPATKPDTAPHLPSPMVSIETGYTPDPTFHGNDSEEIPEVATSRKDYNYTSPKDRLADVSNSSNENCFIRTNQQGEVGIIHLIIVGVGCVFGLITIALLKGVDGVVMASGIAAIVALISGFSGYKIGQKSIVKKEE